MDIVTNNLSDLFDKLRGSLSYLLATDPYSSIIKLLAGIILFYLAYLIIKRLFSHGSSNKTNFASSARNALRHGDYAAAADYYMYDGKLQKAYELYLKAGAKKKAADAALQMKKIDSAINLMLEAGDPSGAAKIAKGNNNFVKAAQIYESIDSTTEAASAYEQAKDYTKAAQMYERAEMFQNAGELYLKINNISRAAQCYLKAFNSDYAKDKMEIDPEYASRMVELADKTGDLLSKINMHEKAAKIYAVMRLYDLAAQAYKKANKPVDAAEVLLKMNKPIEAAELLESAGDHVKANTIKAEYYRGENQPEKAAQHYEAIGEYVNAAELYAIAGNYKKSGEMYGSSKEYELAAEMYENAMELQASAAFYEKAGNLIKAKQLYEYIGDRKSLIITLSKEGKFIEAAEQYIQLGLVDAAIQVLQKVTPDRESDYIRACVMLGDLFINKSMYTQALEKYKKIIGKKPLDKITIDAYYGVAVALENTGESQKALMIYEKIIAEDINYKDTQKRIDKIRKQSAAPFQKVASEIKRYEIIKEIGRGNMGKVYEAYDNVLERKVAYKVPSIDLEHNAELLNDFLREAKSAAALNHQNIVIVYDAGNQGNEYYIAMELVQGKMLKDMLAARGSLPLKRILNISQQLARALVYAHNKNVIHRDVKPGNVMITEDSTVKLMDFGLAKIIHDATQHTTKIIGTPYYMSPEQIKGDKIDFRTDIYSFGVVLFEMITGTPPFTKGDIYYHHLHTAPPSPKDIVNDIPQSLNDITVKCLQKEPTMRFNKTSDLLVSITAVV
ncbi:MAG: protein kinase [Deltaproteobacteria bacterium]|nr:protein kinase [Deltaproteobacteria bacterium]MCL5791668.1 protein kinase [Deltaproteobacteria bacterium]